MLMGQGASQEATLLLKNFPAFCVFQMFITVGSWISICYRRMQMFLTAAYYVPLFCDMFRLTSRAQGDLYTHIITLGTRDLHSVDSSL